MKKGISILLFLMVLSTVSGRTNFTSGWKKVDKLVEQQAYTTAYGQADSLLQRARQEKDSRQTLKGTCLLVSLAKSYQEEADTLAVGLLKAILPQVEEPERALAHVLLGVEYRNYLQSNHWRIGRQSRLEETPADFRLWDKQTFADTINYYFQRALEATQVLQQTAVKDYSFLLEKGNKEGARLRPTLYDVVVMRILDNFAVDDDEDGVLLFSDSAFYGTPEAFLQMPLPAKGTTPLTSFSGKVSLLQDLTRFHRTSDASVRAMVDLQRMDLFDFNTELTPTESYCRGLETLISYYGKTTPVVTQFYYSLAFLFSDAANEYEQNGDFPYAGLPPEGYFVEEGNNPLTMDNNRAKAIDYCTQACNLFPKSEGAVNCYNLKAQLQNPSIAKMTLPEVCLPEQPNLALLTYSNLQKVYFRIVADTTKEVESIKMPSVTLKEVTVRSKKKDRELSEYEQLLLQPVLRQWEQTVENKGDYLEHSAYVDLPALPCGSYVLLVSNDPKFSVKKTHATVKLSVTSMAVLLERVHEPACFQGLVVNRKDGKAITNCSITLWEKNRQGNVEVGHYTPDQKGYFTLTNMAQNKNYAISVTDGCSSIIEQIHSYHPSSNNEPRTDCSIFTDRYTYKPGDSIRYKAMLFISGTQKGHVYAGQSLTLKLMNESTKVLGEFTGTTDEFGAISGVFPIAPDELPGRVVISASYGDPQLVVKLKRLNIEAFKQPTFTLHFEESKEVLMLNKTLSVNGRAVSFTEVPISGARVNYTVERSVEEPYWGSRYPFKYHRNIVVKGTTTTDQDGRFTISFESLPDPTENPLHEPCFNYQVWVDVTDSQGETQSQETALKVGYQTLHLATNIPNTLLKGDSLIYAFTNLNRVMVEGSVQVKLEKLKVPSIARFTPSVGMGEKNDDALFSHYPNAEAFHALYPEMAYQGEEQMSHWPVERVCLDQWQTLTAEKATSLHAGANWQEGAYRITFTYQDQGKERTAVHHFCYLTPESRRYPGQDLLWMHNYTPQTTVGDTARLGIGTRFTDVQVHYFIENEYRLMAQGTWTLSNELREISIPVNDSLIGGFTVRIAVFKENEWTSKAVFFQVIQPERQLDIHFTTFRDHLQPGQPERWTLNISHADGSPAEACLTASLYDAALDGYGANEWGLSPWTTRRMYHSLFYGKHIFMKWGESEHLATRSYSRQPVYYALPNLSSNLMLRGSIGGLSKAMLADGLTVTENMVLQEVAVGAQTARLQETGEKKESNPSKEDTKGIWLRKNLSHTAFFEPDLRTDAKGNVQLTFMAPERLTRWNFKGLAYTQDLATAEFLKQLVTRKELMVQPNVPRFLRQGDEIAFPAKVMNQSDRPLEITVSLQLTDARTGKPLPILKETQQVITLPAGSSKSVFFRFTVPQEVYALTYCITATSDSFSDGEQDVIPVVPNRTMVTESLAMFCNGKGTKTFHMASLENNHSTTLQQHRLTLEFTSHPIWYAIQALPFLNEVTNPGNEQLFQRYYANSLSAYLLQRHPAMEEVFKEWAALSPDAFLSNLEKNAELKQIVVSQTPFLLSATTEQEQKRQLATFFCKERTAAALQACKDQLLKRQGTDGGWAWMEGFNSDLFTTLTIVNGLGELVEMGAMDLSTDSEWSSAVEKAIDYLDNQYYQLYLSLKENKINLQFLPLNYLYVRSFFPKMTFKGETRKAYNQFARTAREKGDLYTTLLERATLSLLYHRQGELKKEAQMVAQLKESALYQEEMGMYWRDNQGGYYWYQSPVFTQARLIRAFQAAGESKEVVGRLQQWLLKQKQTTHWGNSAATAQAVYALLLDNEAQLQDQLPVSLTVGGTKVRAKAESGTGYLKCHWEGASITPAMGQVTVKKSTDGPAWGALYWQYLEDFNKIEASQTGFSLKADYYQVVSTPQGETLQKLSDKSHLKVGDKVRMRLVFSTDRPMDYVQIRAMRPAGLEPLSTHSGYRWTFGVGYYAAVENTVNTYYVYSMDKGSYTLEYDLWASHAGQFSCGNSTLQCLYAPEFRATSKGLQLTIEE